MKVKHTRGMRLNVNHQDGESRGESAFLLMVVHILSIFGDSAGTRIQCHWADVHWLRGF